MTKFILPFALSVLTAGALFVGCEKSSDQKVADAKDKVAEVKQDLKEARTEYRAEWATFKKESEAAIEANEKRIDAFKAKMEKGTPAMKTKYGKDVAALEQKNRDLKAKLEAYEDGGESNWEEFKTNFKHDMDAVGKTMTDLFKDNN